MNLIGMRGKVQLTRMSDIKTVAVRMLWGLMAVTEMVVLVVKIRM